MKARYNRISTATQKLDRQLVKEQKGEKIFNDKISGSIPFEQRPEAQKLIEAINEGEVNYVSVSSIDRLGRNLLDVLNTVKSFTEKGINLHVDNLGQNSLIPDSKTGKLKENKTFNMIVSVMANVAEMERENMLERQREGIALAKAKGTYKGRVKGSREDNKVFLAKHKEVIKHLKAKQSLRNTAKLSDVSLGTVQKVKRILKEEMQTA